MKEVFVNIRSYFLKIFSRFGNDLTLICAVNGEGRKIISTRVV